MKDLDENNSEKLIMLKSKYSMFEIKNKMAIGCQQK
jgi:hypothetical protein